MTDFLSTHLVPEWKPNGADFAAETLDLAEDEQASLIPFKAGSGI